MQHMTTLMKRAATIAIALVAGMVLAAGPPASAADRVIVTPDVANLPAGGLPGLPYVNWPDKEIVDGTRHVSIAGIAARVTALHKVSGGYLLVRRLKIGSDLVLVTNAGARRVLVGHFEDAGDGPGLGVNHAGNKLMVNTNRIERGNYVTYVDTRVLSLPSGKLLRKRDFGAYGGVLAFGVDRAVVHVKGAIRWWNPTKNTLSTIRTGQYVDRVDLTAWQWVVRGAHSTLNVQAIPPTKSPNWSIDQVDISFGTWSPDDSKLLYHDMSDDNGEAPGIGVFDPATGKNFPFNVRGNFPPQMTWESDTAVLLRTRLETPDVDDPKIYQLIRCTLSGVCTKVGPSTPEIDGSIIPATRRNS